MDRILSAIRRLFSSERGASDHLISRWLFLRALGFIYFSAFFSLVFQIRGLIGPQGILPAGDYLQEVAHALGPARGLWYAPTLLWFSSSSHMLMALCWVGMIASVLLLLNLWPRATLVVCFVCFLSFVSAAQDFSGYQSDGMLLEAGFIALFFAPSGIRPSWGSAQPPSRASLFLLRWEWFRIYFESGVVKLLSHDPQWRNFTAMDEYYQNGPLPTWIGWYVQHLPHWFHAGTVYATLALELGLVWMFFLPRRWRVVCFLIVTPWQAGVILTANYTFLNYLVLALGFLLLDDRWLQRFLPRLWRKDFTEEKPTSDADNYGEREQPAESSEESWEQRFRHHFRAIKLALSAVMLTWIFYATMAEFAWMFSPLLVTLPTTPVVALEPFRIANRYGLFAVMTQRTLRAGVPGLRRWQNLAAISVPLQAAGPGQISRNLRSLPAALRLEPVVRFFRRVARLPNRPPDRSPPALQRPGRAGSVCRQSLPPRSAPSGARRDVAILVHHPGGETEQGPVVAARIFGAVRAYVAERVGWNDSGG